MDRCDVDVKDCRVTFTNHRYPDDETILPFGPHHRDKVEPAEYQVVGGMTIMVKPPVYRNEPVVTTKYPYDGPLCQHDRDFLLGRPGWEFHRDWRFDVKVEGESDGLIHKIFGRKE
mgnify:CR=1 FL=1